MEKTRGTSDLESKIKEGIRRGNKIKTMKETNRKRIQLRKREYN